MPSRRPHLVYIVICIALLALLYAVGSMAADGVSEMLSEVSGVMDGSTSVSWSNGTSVVTRADGTTRVSGPGASVDIAPDGTVSVAGDGASVHTAADGTKTVRVGGTKVVLAPNSSRVVQTTQR